MAVDAGRRVFICRARWADRLLSLTSAVSWVHWQVHTEQDIGEKSRIDSIYSGLVHSLNIQGMSTSTRIETIGDLPFSFYCYLFSHSVVSFSSFLLPYLVGFIVISEYTQYSYVKKLSKLHIYPISSVILVWMLCPTRCTVPDIDSSRHMT